MRAYAQKALSWGVYLVVGTTHHLIISFSPRLFESDDTRKARAFELAQKINEAIRSGESDWQALKESING